MDPAVVNGWTLYQHPLFEAQLEALIAAAERERRRDPKSFARSDAAKRLAAVRQLMFEHIPADPGAKAFRLGEALGPENKNWFRAKFFQQYRLFYRFDSRRKVIVFAWLNDDETLRAYAKKSDAYRTFRKNLALGRPPPEFESLLQGAKAIGGKTGR
jgi:toxin YhaV